ncbi:MAG: peptide chain release factor N(5)-glutamine methyltransferase [Bdellovibrionaceae bacterium]|nr:peptide chain release factor N(5)-glutamine methyltransferase [Pseudobdellovibrionaceae bacterium]
MTVKELLKLSDSKIDQLSFSDLDKKNIKRDCRHLLSAFVPCPFNQLLLFNETKIKKTDQDIFTKQLSELITGKPLAYILEKQNFYKSVFFVDHRVLIPRMETELLVESVLKYFSAKKNLSFADFGTGSGCVVLSLLKEFFNSTAAAVDCSNQALKVAKYNAKKLSVSERVDFHHCSVKNFNPFVADKKLAYDFITGNPPYIAENAYIHPFVKAFEPKLALMAGNQGLEFLLSWAQKAVILLKPNGYYFFEFGDNQKDALKAPLSLLFSQVTFLKDLQGIYRVAICKK